jgi:hypothetical protein
MKVVKSAGPEYTGGPLRGHCYDGSGWTECDFWDHSESESRCTLFGGTDGVFKIASESLRICDKVYGVTYDGEV